MMNDTYLYIRDAQTAELCAVRKSGSITLQHLQEELGVSTVLECDRSGNAVSRAVTLAAPSEVLHSGRTYIVTREHRNRVTDTAAAHSSANAIMPKNPSAVSTTYVKPAVTFNSNVTIREFALPSPAVPDLQSTTPCASANSSQPRAAMTPGVHLSFSASQSEMMPQPSPSTAVHAPRPHLHFSCDGSVYSASSGDIDSMAQRDFIGDVDRMGVEDLVRRNLAAIDSFDAAVGRRGANEPVMVVG